MVLTYRARYWLCLLGIMVGVLAYVVSKVFFHLDFPDRYFWWVFLAWFLMSWRITPPYKGFDFKMETVYFGSDTDEGILVWTGLGSTWKVAICGIDPEKGLCLEISRLKGILSESVQSESLGKYYLVRRHPGISASEYSGHLDILVVSPDGIRKERYLEKMRSGSFGIVLEMGGMLKNEEKKGFAALVIIKRRAGLIDMFKPSKLPEGR